MLSMNSGSGAFHGSCLWLARLPNFFGFNPSSLAIWICACDNLNFFLASIHGRTFCGMKPFFAIATHSLFYFSHNVANQPTDTAECSAAKRRGIGSAEFALLCRGLMIELPTWEDQHCWMAV